MLNVSRDLSHPKTSVSSSSMCTAPRASPATPCQPGIGRWMSLGWREHERRCVNTACVRTEPVAWCWHSQEQNHCSLSKSWTGRKKRKGRRVAGEETSFPAAGWEQPPIPVLVPMLWKEQQNRSPLHPISPSTHFWEAPAHLQLLRSDKAFPKASPAPWTTANLLFPGTELS